MSRALSALKHCSNSHSTHVTIRMLEAVDGILLATPDSYEHEAVDTMREWFMETSRPAYVCGPLLPSASKTMAAMYEMDESDSSDEVKWFLDATLARSGEKSLLYVSLGELFLDTRVDRDPPWFPDAGRDRFRSGLSSGR